MRVKRLWLSIVFVGLVLNGGSSALALVAGFNVDVHMDIPNVDANDFHVGGRVQSGDADGNWSEPPVLIDHIDGMFPNFTYSITPDIADPNENWFIIRADWSGFNYTYCEVLQLGLFFDVVCHNAVVDLVGWWTLDGEKIAPPVVSVPPLNGGFVPILSFEVLDTVVDAPETYKVRNDSNTVDEGGTGIPIELVELWLVPLTPIELHNYLGDDPYKQLNADGRQNELPWRMVPLPPDPILDPFEFFIVILNLDLDINIPAGGFLIARGLMGFENNNEEPDLRWVWHVHEAHDLPDLGDASDSSNSSPSTMTAYPLGGPPGVLGWYPTVYQTGSPPHGPIHWRPWAVAFLGPMVSGEQEADMGFDQDGLLNLDPPGDLPDQDAWPWTDDGVPGVPLTLAHCDWTTTFNYQINVMNPNVDLYVNVWFDWDRDGDWDETHTCTDGTSAPEWAVQDQLFPAGSLVWGLNNVTTPAFVPWHPVASPNQEIWMRITLSERQWTGSGGPGVVGTGGSGPVAGYEFGETEDYYFLPDVPELASDLGDAPDSSNNSGALMTAYPSGGPPGILANYATVYLAGSPPNGPIHWQPLAQAWLGQNVSLENEADMGPDQDGLLNLDPMGDLPDRDDWPVIDDGVNIPLHLTHCDSTTTFNYTIMAPAPGPGQPMYVNVWFDWNRDGDWDDTHTCADGTTSPEWAVQDQAFPVGSLVWGLNNVTTPAFTPWHPAATAAQPIWMRITLSEQQWVGSGSGMVGDGGSGPVNGYQFGETEDYYFRPECPLPADLNSDGRVDGADFVIFGFEWLQTTCP